MLIIAERSNAAPSAENEKDLFDIALDEEVTTPKQSRTANGKPAANTKRQKKDEKYGFGGRKRFKKSNDSKSANDMRDFSVKRMKGKGGAAKRPGKDRRAKMKG